MTASLVDAPDALCQHVIPPVLQQFDALVKKRVRFNLIFAALGAIQSILLIFFFPFLFQSALFAVTLAGLVLTIFAYFIMRQYFDTVSYEKMEGLADKFLKGCETFNSGSGFDHSNIAQACAKLADKLHNREYRYYSLPNFLKTFSPLAEKLSCWLHWQDIHQMKEILLLKAIHEHIQWVKKSPTSLEAHAALANSYVMLSGLYEDPRNVEGFDEERWVPEEAYSKNQSEKFKKASERAIEEFKIMSGFAPHDPWVHTQLALSYKDLKRPADVIKAYETVRALRPNDTDVLYKLGILYFEQGENALGLKIYEEIKKSDMHRSEKLIEHYGAYSLKGSF